MLYMFQGTIDIKSLCHPIEVFHRLGYDDLVNILLDFILRMQNSSTDIIVENKEFKKMKLDCNTEEIKISNQDIEYIITKSKILRINKLSCTSHVICEIDMSDFIITINKFIPEKNMKMIIKTQMKLFELEKTFGYILHSDYEFKYLESIYKGYLLNYKGKFIFLSQKSDLFVILYDTIQLSNTPLLVILI